MGQYVLFVYSTEIEAQAFWDGVEAVNDTSFVPAFVAMHTPREWAVVIWDESAEGRQLFGTPVWGIAHPRDFRLFWNEERGWVPEDKATGYSSEEMHKTSLPDEGGIPVLLRYEEDGGT